MFIQITLNAGRTVEMKKALYSAITQRLSVNPGVRPADVTISLDDVAKEDWWIGLLVTGKHNTLDCV